MKSAHQNAAGKIVAGVVVIGFVFMVGMFAGRNSTWGGAILRAESHNVGQQISDEQFAPFWKAWAILDEKFVNSTTTDSQERVWGAIKGLAESQGDPYTVFFPPEEHKIFAEEISGNFEGVGMEIDIRDDVITVVAPLKGSPAERADVRPGDVVVAINGESSLDLSVTEAVKRIRGEKGTTVMVTFVRKGEPAPLVKTITRDVIDISPIEIEIKNASSASTTPGKTSGLRTDGVFVLRLSSFTETSPRLFRDALRQFIESGSDKLVLDLRGNPGGYLNAAVDMASWFLPQGKVIVSEDFGGKAEGKAYRSKGYNIFKPNRLKMVILVNAGSASASEILAGALREHNIAKLVGVKTFGKGSVQELIQLTEETSLKVTVAQWLTPLGHNLSKGGLEPDVIVEMTENDIKTKKDPQLDKAVEILRALP
jgi:carboxyl-terminal processing protease